MQKYKLPIKRTGNTRMLLLVSLLAIVQGCGSGSKKFGIDGTASFEGAAIKMGTILFMPTSETLPQTVGKIVDGRYDLQPANGVLPGKYKVRITAYRGTGKTGNRGPLSGNKNVEMVEQYLPAKFNANTDLTVVIEEEKRKYDFDLRIRSP